MTESPTAKYTKFWHDVFGVVSYDRQFRSGNDNLTISVEVDRNFSAYIIEPLVTQKGTYFMKKPIYSMIQLMFCFSTLLSRLAFHICIYRIFRPIARTADYLHQGSFVSKWEKQVSRSPTPADNNGGSLVPYRKRYPFFFPFSGS